MSTSSNVTPLHPVHHSGASAVAENAATDKPGRKSERAMWWFKLKNDCMRDPIVRTIARRSGQACERVFTVIVALKAEASGASDRGSVAGFDAEGLGAAFDIDEHAIMAVVQALTEKGWIADGRIADWEKTQPARDEPSSTPRVQAYRERKAAERDATEVKRHETRGNGLESESESESESEKRQRIPLSNESRSPAGSQVAFDAFWDAWPNKVGKRAAQGAFSAALKRVNGDAGRIMAGLERYKANKPADRQWLNPATFLNQDRFDDEPAAPSEADPMGKCYDPGDQLDSGKRMRRSEYEREYGKFNLVWKWRPLTEKEQAPQKPIVWGKIQLIEGGHYERVDRADWPNYDWDSEGVGHSRTAPPGSPAGRDRIAAIAAGKLPPPAS